jgi:shikimate dehydrogenase
MRDQTVSGTTRLVGLLGNPLGHSLSPLIHNHVYATLGIKLAYVPLEVSTSQLHTVLHALRACRFAGANVTIPYKQAAVPYCDVLSPLSALTGTVNTLYFRDNTLHGTTTDWEGLRCALSALDIDAKNKAIVILGNGGTGRTFAFALASQKIPGSLTIVGRDARKVEYLASEVSQTTGFPVGGVLFSSEKLDAVMNECTLCINCTPVGMHPRIGESPINGRFLHAGMVVFDTVYNPGKTALCNLAEKAGCRWSGGLSMLVYQALASIRYFTGREVTEDAVDMKHLLASLEGRLALAGESS